MLSMAVYAVNYDAIRGDGHRSGRCEMDSHADTCVAGSNRVVLEFTGQTAEVEAYSPDYPSKQIPIATVATAYGCPTSGATFVLIINEALYFGDSLPFSLISPNQLIDNDVHVDERHRQHAPDSIFGILISSEPLQIPFSLEGVIAGFDTRPPTQKELDDIHLHVKLTSVVKWVPYTFAHSLAEEDVANSDDDERRISKLQARRIKVLHSKSVKQKIRSCMSIMTASQFPFEIQTADEIHVLNQTDPILERIAALSTTAGSNERMISGENRAIAAVRTGDVTTDVTPDNVSQRWMVGLETAKTSLKVTTQQGVRSIPKPAMRRFKTQMAHLRYPRLRGMFYADIMEPKVKAVDSHRYAHIIGNAEEMPKPTRWCERMNQFMRSMTSSRRWVSQRRCCVTMTP
jgi:hypothetical protein